MATRPKGYLPKGKTKSFDAVRKANARKDLTTLKGIGGIVGSAILNSPGGRAIKVGKAANKIVKGITTGKAKAITKPNRTFENGRLGTKKGQGMVSNAEIKKGKNSKANITDQKSVDKALRGTRPRLITKAEKKENTKSKSETKLIKQYEKYPNSKPYGAPKVPVKKKVK